MVLQMKKPETPDLLTSLSLSVVVLLITTIIFQVYSVFKWWQVLIGVAITICIFIILETLFLAFTKSQHNTELESVLNQLKVYVPSIPWLYNDEALAKIESEVLCKSIWIISPDLSNVTEKQEIISAVKKNIDKGVKYTYIVPNSNPVKAVLPRLQELFGQSGKLNLIKLTPSRFQKLSVTHIAIFNPRGVDNIPAEVFLELPIEKAGGKKIRGFWIRVANDAAKDLIGRFQDIVEETQSKAVA
jgi:hypothetical protein